MICGGKFCISLDYSGNVWCCGDNSYNILSPTVLKTVDYYQRNDPINSICPFQQRQNVSNINQIACGNSHAVFCDNDGNLFLFGFTKIGSDINGIKINNIPPVTFISCGYDFTVFVTNNGTVYSFGGNGHGQLGHGNYSTVKHPKQIENLNRIEYIECGSYHTIAISNEDAYYSWGYGGNGELGLGNFYPTSTPELCENWPKNIISVKCGNSRTVLLTSDNSVYYCGTGLYKAPKQKNTKTPPNRIKVPMLIKELPEIKQIQCGYHNCFFIDMNNTVWVLGDNICLGLGTTKETLIPKINESLTNIVAISNGGYSTFVKTSDNKIYAFGNNAYYQLGFKPTNDNTGELTPIQVLIDNESIWDTLTRSKAKSARK